VLNQGPRRDEIVPLLKTDVDLEHQKMYIRKENLVPRGESLI
jgi:hypothetical protein